MRETSTTPLVAWSRGFPAVPEQVREARQFLATILDGRSTADDALLCLSELVTNAVVHSKSGKPAGQITVRAQLHGSHLRVEVTDQGGPWTAQSSDPAGLHGRGLVIISRLADAWGRIGNSTVGWTVWFEMTSAPIAPRPTSPGGTDQRWTEVLNGQTLRQLRHKSGQTQEQLAALTADATDVLAAFDQAEMDFDDPDGGFRYGGGRNLSKLEQRAKAGDDEGTL